MFNLLHKEYEKMLLRFNIFYLWGLHCFFEQIIKCEDQNSLDWAQSALFWFWWKIWIRSRIFQINELAVDVFIFGRLGAAFKILQETRAQGNTTQRFSQISQRLIFRRQTRSKRIVSEGWLSKVQTLLFPHLVLGKIKQRRIQK